MKHSLLAISLCVCLAFSVVQVSKAQSNPVNRKPIELHGVKLFDAYPNPASSFVTFAYTVSGEHRNVELEVFNVIGEVVSTRKLNAGSSSTKLFINTLKEGIYFYRLSIDGQKSSVKKLVIR